MHDFQLANYGFLALCQYYALSVSYLQYILLYVRLLELLTELTIARGNGTYPRVIQQYKKPAPLILDEWRFYPIKETEVRDLLEIAEARYKKAPTIFCSQFDVPGWREKIGDPILADAICDRIVLDSYSIVIDCKESMRKRTERRQRKRCVRSLRPSGPARTRGLTH